MTEEKTRLRYHKIGATPKTNHNLPEPEKHKYSELVVTVEGLKELLWQLAGSVNRDLPINRDKAYVAFKLLYRLWYHHELGEEGRPRYPPFSWTVIERVAEYGTEPFAYPGLKLGTEVPTQ